MQISRDYGVLLEDEGIALRGLFLIDPKGTLRYALSLFSVTVLITWSDKLLSMTYPLVVLLRKLFVSSKHSSSRYIHHLVLYLFTNPSKKDEHGEVCPVNWTEGSKTIKADPLAKLEYFSTANTNGNANGHTNGENGSAKKRARTDTN